MINSRSGEYLLYSHHLDEYADGNEDDASSPYSTFVAGIDGAVQLIGVGRQECEIHQSVGDCFLFVDSV